MRADARKRMEERELVVPLATVTALPPRRRVEPLIGLIGKKRSGKDSFAAALVDGYGFTRYAFADPLKEAALALDPIVDWPHRLSFFVRSTGWEASKEIPEVRRILQNYGVAIREIDPDFWIRATLTPALADPGPVVITDVRFPNEAEAIRRAGGKIIGITRPGLVSTDEHISETALDDYVADATVENSGTLDDLAAAARALL